MIPQEKHIAMIELAAQGLKDLLSEVAFVGGATIILYIDELEISKNIRPTEDIDCVIEIASYQDFAKLEKKLRSLGFSNCQDKDAPICRWVYRGLKVDVMPTEGQILGFSNQWYRSGLENSVKIRMPSGKEIKIFSIPYFLAAKTEAFFDRGKNDFFESKDLEDLITVISGRSSIRKEIYEAPTEVRDFLKTKFSTILEDEGFIQSIAGHLGSYEKPEILAQNVLDVLKNI